MTNFSQMSWAIESARGFRPFRPGDTVMDSWEIVRLIGEGGYGTVYEVCKNRFGVDTHCAMKVIPIPHEKNYVESLRSIGSSDAQIQTELRNQVVRGVSEVKTMHRLIDHPAVVRCEDFNVIQYEDDGSWEIFIRMELLTPLKAWMDKHPVTEAKVRKIGITMADLLQYCGEQKIMHRDIKPGNLFMNSLGNCKLGDFGLARTLSTGSSTHSHGVGTDAFMAPEVAANQHYDTRADQYSLGLVLYWMLNGGYLPFMNDGMPYTQAVMTRLTGRPLPRIAGVEDGLMNAVLKACAYRPEDRFATGYELKNALMMKSVPSPLESTPPLPKKAVTDSPNKQIPPVIAKKEVIAEEKRPKNAKVTVVSKTTDGKVLSQGIIEIGVGQSRTISAPNLKRYKLVSKSQNAIVTVNQHGIPSCEQVVFKYRKAKKKTIVLTIIIVALIAIATIAGGVVGSKEQNGWSKSSLKAGDYVTFGHYPQTQSGSDNTSIEWQVLEVDKANNKALLISRYALDTKPYNDTRDRVTWATCSLHIWLNNDFLNKAFTANERKAIFSTSVSNSQSQGYSAYTTNGGNNTEDRVFLLSYNEAFNLYFTDNETRICIPTGFAVAQGAYCSSDYTKDGKATCCWWLRSPGDNQYSAIEVACNGVRSYNYVDYNNIAIRPTLWIKLDAASN